MGRVEGKIALVTGGAVGLGEAMVRLLAREGAVVIVTDIQDAEGEAVANSIPGALYLHHDVSKEEDWQRVVQTARDKFGSVDVVVNNAGVGVGCPPEEQTLEQWRWLMSINLDGVFL